jgi:SAM-dependent methyltransferase
MAIRASRSDTEWRSYGELDYGASHDLAEGFQEWSLLKNHLAQYGLDEMATCLELGCGAGRLTAALVRDFKKVYALDISPDRIKRCMMMLKSEKVSFHLLREPVFPIADRACSLCISTHVLQHVADTAVIEAYFREMLRVLRSGGCLLIHVPVIGAHGMTGDIGAVLRRGGKEIVKEGVLAISRCLMLAGFHNLPWKVDQYRVFSFVKLSSLLSRIGFVDIELRILPRAGGHAYIFARR